MSRIEVQRNSSINSPNPETAPTPEEFIGKLRKYAENPSSLNKKALEKVIIDSSNKVQMLRVAYDMVNADKKLIKCLVEFCKERYRDKGLEGISDLEIWVLLNRKSPDSSSNSLYEKLHSDDPDRLGCVLRIFDVKSFDEFINLSLGGDELFAVGRIRTLLEGGLFTVLGKTKFEDIVDDYATLVRISTGTSHRLHGQAMKVLAEFERRINETYYSERLFEIKEAYRKEYLQ